MFIRPCYRKKNGKRHAYWALVESYRTDRGPRQHVVAYLGQLKDTERRGVKRAAEGKKKTSYQQLQLFGGDSQSEPEWVEVDKANQQRLYRALDKLLPHKEALETHLKNRLGSLFDLKYDLLLYDVTSTYFEGQCKANPMAQLGYS